MDPMGVSGARWRFVDCARQQLGRIIMAMLMRALLILALVVGPMPSLGVSAERGEVPASCSCCCPAGACQCGCETPPAGDEPSEESGAPGFCGCNDTPLNLPSVPVSVPDPAALQGVVAVPADVVRDSPALAFRGHLAHGPPQPLRMLATVILLN